MTYIVQTCDNADLSVSELLHLSQKKERFYGFDNVAATSRSTAHYLNI